MQENKNSVCIMGLGYVGLTLAATMADVGFNVLGVEIKDDVLEKLNKGEPHFFEPGLKEEIRKAKEEKNIQFAKHIPKDCKADVYIITVGTPLGADGKVRLDMIENVAEEISSHLKDESMVILRSTVKIGTSRNIVLPILQKSGKKFNLAFCPERTLEGQALKELRELPQIVGGIDLNSSIRAAQLFQFVTPTVVRVSSIETAEMIKLIDNVARDVSFGFANEVSSVCDALGISAFEVIKSGSRGYPRTNLPMPGPVGGPCLEKDPYIFMEGLEKTNVKASITFDARKINERQPEEVTRYLAENTQDFPEKPVISLLGVAFKGRPATDDLRGTMFKPIYESLKKYFPLAEFRAYDSLVPKDKIEKFGLKGFLDIEGAIDKSNLVVICNNHPEFANMPIESLSKRLARPAIIYDFWNNFTNNKLFLPQGVKYVAIGSHNLLKKHA